MVCPSCGRQVAGMEAACRFCGAAVDNRVRPLPETVPTVGGVSSPAPSEALNRQRRDANLSLMLGILSFFSLPVAFLLRTLITDLPAAIAFVYFVTAIPAGVLALVFGCRASWATRYIEGKEDSATIVSWPGMVLGAMGAGIWFFALIIDLLPRPYPPPNHGASTAGTLRTINTAAITYSSQYGHGFPLRLSFLAPPKSERREDTNDHAACLIDEILASGNKSGYRFYYVAGPVDSKGMVQTYTVHADPIVPSHEHPYYFTDQTGVIRQQSKWEANATSPPLHY